MILQIKPILKGNEADAVSSYIKSGGWLTEHKITREFEKDICSFLNIKYCHAVPNGTIGLILALSACGIGRGSKVVVPALTMVATANAVKFLGAECVFVDVDTNGCMDIDKLYQSVDCVVYVSLNGRSSGLDKVLKYCEEKDIPLIEDACQSLGSYYGDKLLGTLGTIGVFSFSPHKIITTGQGGAIVTNSTVLNCEVKYLKDFGRRGSGSDDYSFFGINAKFTDLQSVIGIEQLKTIEWRINRKKEIYREYEKHLKEFMLPHISTPWFVDIYISNPDSIRYILSKGGIETRRMYPVVPNLRFHRDDGFYENAEILSTKGLWLPSSLDLTDGDIEYISKIILRSV